MAQPLFSGVGVALVTLFGDDGCLDADATAAHAARLVDLGVRAVVVAGTTGEASTLSPDERGELLRAVRKAIPPGTGIPVIAGTGAPSARQAAALTRDARDGGADGVLVLSPPGSADVLPYYETVAGAAGYLLPNMLPNMLQPDSAMPMIPVRATNARRRTPDENHEDTFFGMADSP